MEKEARAWTLAPVWDLTSVAFDPADENTIYIGYASSQFLSGYNEPYGNRMVFKMDVSDLSQYPAGDLPFDCPGTPCADITMNLPNTFISIGAMMAEQGSDGGLYVATEAGVFFTDNKRIAAFNPVQPEDADDMSNTSGWVKLGGSLPHVGSRGIEANYQVNRVRVGLYGRGVWEHHLHCPDTLQFNEAGTYGADRYLEAMQNITSEAIVPTGLDLKYRAGEEVRLTPGFHAEPGTRFHAFIHPCDAPGNSFHPKAMQAGAPEAEIENESVYVGMELYPNPANGSFTVRANFISENGIATIRVFGPTGNLALSSVMRGPQQFIDSSGLHGLYMVVVECAGVQQTRKIILQ
ncbi:MAG: T9SS type A sorting domain-containing protein [Flavobacteriales bacterium]|nr:T9SS type A sorting domain-containing protein [Flavobacteriales bacterium]